MHKTHLRTLLPYMRLSRFTSQSISTKDHCPRQRAAVWRAHRGQPPPAERTIADELVDFFRDLGVTHAFGVSGRAIAPLWKSLLTSPIRTLHCRHESGAAFSAAQYYFMTGEPTVLFVTTGPG